MYRHSFLEKSLLSLPLAPHTLTGTSHLCPVTLPTFLLGRYTSAPSWATTQLHYQMRKRKQERETGRQTEGGKRERLRRSFEVVSILK